MLKKIGNRFFKKNDSSTAVLKVLMLIGGGLFFCRLLLYTNSFHSGLLYIAFPFTCSLLLYRFTNASEEKGWLKRFWNYLRASLIVILGISVCLMEGYICFLFLLPIYLLNVVVVFIYYYMCEKNANKKKYIHIIPAAMLLMSLEGVSKETSLNRYNEVTYTQVINADVATIKARLAKPLNTKKERHWLLSFFPAPHYVGAAQIVEGAVRNYEFTYRRWGVTNTHHGSLNVEFSKVGEQVVETTIRDSSYLSNYLKLYGSTLRFEPISSQQTRVSLTVKFDRLLDPLWYFEPIERAAVEKGAKYFVQELLAKKI